jgi:hypothetical protein
MVAIKGHFDGKVIVPDEPLNLAPNQRLVIHYETEPAAVPTGNDAASVLLWLAENAVDDPSLPADFSQEVDHYLYGTPKKP